MADAPEYKTLTQCSQKLRAAIQGDIVNLGGQLLAGGLISPNAYSELRNTLIPESDRAARLVALVINKVQLDQRNYDAFINVLSQESPHYRDILRILNETYSTFKGTFCNYCTLSSTVVLIQMHAISFGQVLKLVWIPLIQYPLTTSDSNMFVSCNSLISQLSCL